MKLFLIIAGAVVFIAIVAFGIIGYFKSKKLLLSLLIRHSKAALD
jgi:uncharacterized protein YneF (UPF0154 family)